MSSSSPAVIGWFKLKPSGSAAAIVHNVSGRHTKGLSISFSVWLISSGKEFWWTVFINNHKIMVSLASNFILLSSNAFCITVLSDESPPRSGLLGDGAAEEKDVGLWLVQHVVDPAQALLHTQVPPLGFRHEVRLGHQLG